MRKIFFNFISVLLSIVLLFSIAGCGKSENNDNTNTDADIPITNGLSIRIEEGDENKYEPDDETLFYFYSKMNTRERKIYNQYQDIMDHFNEDNYVNELVIPASLYDGKTYKKLYDKALYAFYLDHPEYYPLSDDATDYNILIIYDEFDEKNNEYKLKLKQSIKYPEYNDELEKMEKSANEILSEIDLNQDDESIALAIHDKLIDIVKYGDKDNKHIDSYYVNHSRCAYGVLVDDADGERFAICSGISAAYQYLLNKAGIKCSTITGYGRALDHDKKEFIGNNHIWNVPYLNNKWVEIDVTNDTMGPNDAEISDEEFIEIHKNIDPITRYEYQHLFFGLTREEMTYQELTFKYTFKNGNTKDIYIGYNHYRLSELEEIGYELGRNQVICSYLNDYLPD